MAQGHPIRCRQVRPKRILSCPILDLPLALLLPL